MLKEEIAPMITGALFWHRDAWVACLKVLAERPRRRKLQQLPPEAIAVLFELASELNRSRDSAHAQLLKSLGGVLGLLERDSQAFLQALPAEGGTRYRSRMELGADTAFGRLLFNRLIRPMVFSDLMGPAWLKHNVEEVGNFVQFLPHLFAHETAT